MKELIYRKAAIDGLNEVICDHSITDFDAIATILDLPSAQPERKNGEWEELGENKDNTHNIRCNQCSEVFKSRGHANSYYTKRKYRFCPNCGADMRGEQNV